VTKGSKKRRKLCFASASRGKNYSKLLMHCDYPTQHPEKQTGESQKSVAARAKHATNAWIMPSSLAKPAAAGIGMQVCAKIG
jgi:hypothetical protein